LNIIAGSEPAPLAAEGPSISAARTSTRKRPATGPSLTTGRKRIGVADKEQQHSPHGGTNEDFFGTLYSDSEEPGNSVQRFPLPRQMGEDAGNQHDQIFRVILPICDFLKDPVTGEKPTHAVYIAAENRYILKFGPKPDDKAKHKYF